MIHVVRPDLTIEVVEGAVSTTMMAGVLVCRNAAGEMVKTFSPTEIIMYGSLESVARVLAPNGAKLG